MGRISIKYKLFLVVALVAFLFLALADLLAYRHIQSKLMAGAHGQAEELLSHVSREMVIGGQWLPPAQLGRIINFHLHLRPRLLSIMIFDAEDKPLHPSAPPEAFHAKFASMLSKSQGALVDLGGDHLYAVVSPVYGGQNRLGSIVGLMNLSDMAQQVEEVRRSFWLLGLATWVPLILALYAAINWLVLGRVQRLGRVSAALAAGDHAARAVVESKDEIGDLALAFNRMAEHLLKAVQGAEREKHRLQVVLDTQNDGLFVVDTQKRVTMVNRRMRDLLGKSEEEVVGRPCSELVQSELCRLECPLFANPLENANGQPGAGVEVELNLPGGQRLSVRKNAKVFRNSAGEVVGGVETFHDISFEKELARLRAEWESFIRHELRTPLQPILGFSRLLAQDPEGLDPQKRRSYLEMIQKSAEHLARLLDMTREVQLYEAGRIKVSLLDYDLAATLRQAAAEAWSGWAAKQAGPLPDAPDWLLQIQPGLDTVLAQDPVKLTRVFRNLLENAWEHHPGTVDVQVSAPAPEYLEVAVRNGGEAIAPERLETIFEKFNTTKAGQGGTGLGTTIARLFVQAHGGMISAASSPEDGTCFRVRLPRRATAAQIKLEAA